MDINEATRFFSGDKFATEVTGIKIEEVKDGYSKCSLTLSEKHLGAHGQVMGGVIFTLADFAFAVATNTETHFTATVDSHISFLSKAKGTRLFAECKKLKEGKTLCFYEITVTDDLGTVVAIVGNTGALSVPCGTNAKL